MHTVTPVVAALKVPAPQSTHASAPMGALAYLPAPHTAHPVTPSPAKPASHTHVALPGAELECGGHAAQLVEPDSLVYLPAGQAVHCIAAEVLEYLPTPQSTHASAPTGALAYLPATHAAHPVTPSPKKPVSHTHVELPAADDAFAGHFRLSDVPPGQK